jgi:predicted enzyme related to lactoylglutathione lyase
MPSPLALIEFPADDPARARRFWSGLLGLALDERAPGQGEGWQTNGAVDGETASNAPAVGVHSRGRGPGDSFSVPYFEVADMQDALARIPSLGGSVVHPGEQWAICKDSEGNPFGLALGAEAGPPSAEAVSGSTERAGTALDDLQRSRP